MINRHSCMFEVWFHFRYGDSHLFSFRRWVSSSNCMCTVSQWLQDHLQRRFVEGFSLLFMVLLKKELWPFDVIWTEDLLFVLCCIRGQYLSFSVLVDAIEKESLRITEDCEINQTNSSACTQGWGEPVSACDYLVSAVNYWTDVYF